MKTKKIIILTLAMALAFPAAVSAEVQALPEVSQEMLSPDFWIKDMKDADTVLADSEAIKALNASYLSCKDCCMNDLAAAEGTFNGSSANLARWKSALTELAKFLDGKHYDDSENTISGKYVMDILNNIDDPEASAEQEIRFGIVVHRSDVRAYPTELIIADDPGDNDFDNVQNSGVRVGEPVTIQGTSSDGKYYYCMTSCVSGWIASADVAVCKDKEEWLSAWQIPDDEVMVVTDSRITLEESNTNPELSGLTLTMGTVLEKVQPYEYGKMITNRSAFYNYPVWIPVRDENGMYDRKRALVSVHHGINEGYLPLTSANIVRQAYTKLGDTYGWGGMLSSVDCSSLVRDVYKCFGLELPRNTTWQSAMPVEKYDISMADDIDKKELFDKLPAGSILFFKGHEMLYLGENDGNYYVLSATSSMMYPGTKDRARVRSVIINTLEEKRANGNTWLGDLYEACVPYIPNEENILTPVFSIKEKKETAKSETEEEKTDLPYEEIAFDSSWEYAGNSKINDGIARLYRSESEERKDFTVCINAGHGTKGGADVKTLCHPDGSPKIVSGSTAAGAVEATAISNGVVMANGRTEAEATLKAAMVVKEELLAAGYDVLMIRETDDVQLDNIARTLIADHYADAHIALHYDSTDNDKGVFYCSVPDDEDYKNMEPVRSSWQLDEKLGKSLIYGLEQEGFKKWNTGALAMDLTQTSYSTIASVDLEIGDTVSDRSYKTLIRVADGIREGLDYYYESQRPLVMTGGDPWIDSDVKQNVTSDMPVDAKDDFYLFVNRDWAVSTDIPVGAFGYYGLLDDSQQETVKDAMSLLTDTSVAGKDAQLIRDYYQAYSDWDARDKAGLEPIMKTVDAINDIRSFDDLREFYADFDKSFLVPRLVSVGIDQDMDDSSSLVVFLSEPSLLIGDPAEYKELTEHGNRAIEAYGNEIVTQLMRLGYANDEAKKVFADAVSFETKLAQNCYAAADRQNPDYADRINNKYSKEELAALAPNVPLAAFIDNAGYGDAKTYIVSNPDYIRTLDDIFSGDDIEMLKAYLLTRFLDYSAPYVDRESMDVEFEAIRGIYGDFGTMSDEQIGFDVVKKTLSDALIRAYIEKNDMKNLKTDVTGLCEEIIDAYCKMLRQEEWLSEDTREAAIEKLEAIRIFAVYPDKFKCDYEGLDIKGKSFYEASKAIALYTRSVENSLVNGETDNDLWNAGSILEAVGTYNPQNNSIYIPAALLNGKMYSEDMSEEELMGGIGYIIGHEISHAFDLSGARFDKNGNLSEWWNESDYEEYEKKARKVTKYYDGFTAWEGHKVSGEMITDEAIADMGGLRVLLSIANDKEDFDYDTFFKKVAEVYKSVRSTEGEEYCLHYDEHPLPYMRTNVALQQFDEFLETYDIKEGDNMYVAPEERIAVW